MTCKLIGAVKGVLPDERVDRQDSQDKLNGAKS